MSMSRRVTLSALVCMSFALAAGSANARDYPKEIEGDLSLNARSKAQPFKLSNP